MRKRLRYIPVVLAVLLFFLSCNRRSLDIEPKDRLSSLAVWKDPTLVGPYIANLYNGLRMGGYDSKTLATVTDEAVFLHGDAGVYAVNTASITAVNNGFTSETWDWKAMYSQIRACNLAIINMRTSTFDDAVLKDHFRGESHFLRAFYYQQLLRYYGAVPLISNIYGLNEDYTIARNTFDECVKFIVADCDSAITYLQGKSIEKGRASSLAAMALKSRVLIYAASDLFDIPTAKAKSALIAGYSNPEYLGYVSGDRIARWTAAKNAAKALLDATSGYKLDLSASATSAEAQAYYISVAMAGGSKAVDAQGEQDLILGKYFNPATVEQFGGWAGGNDASRFHLYSGPNGYHNWSNHTPIGQLVDDYEMMDAAGNAVPFSWSDPLQKADPYKKRDPRFYASILYDGAPWKDRGSDPAETQYGFYDLMIKNNSGTYEIKTFNGLDTRKSSIEDWNGSPTGYNMRKFTDPDPGIKGQNEQQYIPWPLFRYTEVIFNYAEACNALGEDVEAKNWIKKIRFRAGMPELSPTLTGIALQDAIRHEKRIEMVFEEQRYFDIRRWMIAPDVIKRATLIGIKGKFKVGMELKDKYRHDETIYDYTYEPFTSAEEREDKKWDDKMYFRPINRDEMLKNTKLTNNPGF